MRLVNNGGKNEAIIHFHVHKSSKGETSVIMGIEKIMFDVIHLNLGEAFNKTTGIFTAPTPGVYQFVFKGMIANASKKSNDFFAFLVHNGKNVALTRDSIYLKSTPSI